MIWRIVRKDWKLLWPLVAMVTVAQLGNAFLWQALGQFGEPKGLLLTAQVLSYLVFLGIAALIAAAVQQDVVPGVSQDWLIRPIPRGAMFRAKLLFVLLCVHGPMLLADVLHGFAAGFTARDAMSAALVRTVCVLLAFSLPVMALASATRTLVQVAVDFLGIWLLVVIGVAVGVAVRGGQPPVFAATGMQWMTPAFWSILALTSAVVVLPLQYLRRSTQSTRMFLVCAPVLAYRTWAMKVRLVATRASRANSASSQAAMGCLSITGCPVRSKSKWSAPLPGRW